MNTTLISACCGMALEGTHSCIPSADPRASSLRCVLVSYTAKEVNVQRDHVIVQLLTSLSKVDS